MTDSRWTHLRTQLEHQLDPEDFKTWFGPLTVQSEDSRQLVLRAPSQHFVHTLEESFRPAIDHAVANLTGPGFEVLLTVDRVATLSPTERAPADRSPAERAPADRGPADRSPADRSPADRSPADRSPADRSPAKRDPSNGRPAASVDSQFDHRYTFETFVVGSSNQFAHAAARAVGESPSRSYNPLFVYGGVGLGKTHLMQAIGHEITLNFPDLKVLYTPAEQFVNELINSIRFDRMPAFRDRYRTIDVLMIDDIQFIANKERTQEEFFHTFNTLYNSQKQIILSSDSSPRQIPTLEERLRSRFEWGLIADIQPPELETKVAILRRKADAEKMAVPDDVALFIAQQVRSNIRELEGLLNRVVAFASLTGESITLEVAKETLRDILPPENQRTTASEIVKFVARHYGLKVGEIKSKNNSKHIVFPRQVAMFLCKQLTDLSYPDIGKHFNNKHHSTVMYSVKEIEKKRKEEPEIDRVIQGLIDHFN